MRTLTASFAVAAMMMAALVVTGLPAAAQPAEGGATVTPYQQCANDDPAISSCVTGKTIVRLTTTPSGALSLTQIDNGRFEAVNSDTGCTTTGSYIRWPHRARLAGVGAFRTSDFDPGDGR